MALTLMLAQAAVSGAREDPTFISHQGGMSVQACMDGGSGMMANVGYTVASDNAINSVSTQTWDYVSQGSMTFYNPGTSNATITLTTQMGDQTICGSGPNSCYFASSTTYTIPPGTFSVPWVRFLTNQPVSDTQAFYVVAKSDTTGVQCKTQSYITTEHDGDD